MQVLWEDETAIMVHKPSGVLVHNSAWAGPREDTVVSKLGGNPHPVHRLDRGTSGVLLLARSGDDAAAWQAALAHAGTSKLYLALVRGEVRGNHNIIHPLKDERGVSHPAHSMVFPLLTRAEPRCSLVAARLLTGRRHQAREHLHHISHPVIGDANYGKGPINRELSARYGCGRLCLHAARLRITHPFTGNVLDVSAPIPPDLREPWERIFGVELEGALASVLRGAWDISA